MLKVLWMFDPALFREVKHRAFYSLRMMFGPGIGLTVLGRPSADHVRGALPTPPTLAQVLTALRAAIKTD